MSRFQLNISISRKLFSVLLILYVGLNLSAQENMLTVISNSKGAPAQLKMSELKSIMKGEKQRWSDGTKLTIVLMKTNTPVGLNTCSKIYNMSGDKVKRFWLGLSFSGKAEAPTFCNTVEELESIISQTPGAIGILDVVSGNANIKTIQIDGKNSF